MDMIANVSVMLVLLAVQCLHESWPMQRPQANTLHWDLMNSGGRDDKPRVPLLAASR